MSAAKLEASLAQHKRWATKQLETAQAVEKVLPLLKSGEQKIWCVGKPVKGESRPEPIDYFLDKKEALRYRDELHQRFPHHYTFVETLKIRQVPFEALEYHMVDLALTNHSRTG